MIRRFRSEFAYHVFNRGVERREIFLDIQDYRTFLRYLRIYLLPVETSKRLFPYLTPNLVSHNLYGQIKLLSYCLMPNHFHLQIQPELPEAIPQLMKQLSNAYTIYFNQKYDRLGSLFQGRYKAAEITTDELNIHVHRYIHLNPIMAGLTKNITRYPWSSFHEYQKPNGPNNVCKTKEFLSHFNTFKEYEQFLLDHVKAVDASIIEISID